MGVIEYSIYTIACDGCGDEIDKLYEDELDAERAAEEYGWVKKGHDYLCKVCEEVEEEEYTGP